MQRQVWMRASDQRLWMRHRTAVLSCLVVVFSGLLAAQTLPLSELEVRLVFTPHGGCFGPCVRYGITVRGDGSVEYNGVGLVEGNRTRTISSDDVVMLVNEFLQAHFFDALDTYRDKTFVVRKGDFVTLLGSGGSDDPQTDLTLRIGDRKKTVSLYNNYPAELGRLAEHVESIGGPRVWK
jgi:hypothetical protein